MILHIFFFLAACSSITDLRNQYHIEDQTLTTESGEKFNRYPFESKLHFDLAYAVKDLQLANRIYDAYKAHILPLIVQLPDDGLSYEVNLAFARALIDVCHYFGSAHFSPLEPLKTSLRFHGQSDWMEKHKEALRSFVIQACRPLYALPEKEKGAPFTVVILSTTCSGGNHAAALSIAKFLESQPNVRAHVIDVEETAQECDPVMVATHQFTYDMIYANILQKTNDLGVIKERKALYREIQNYIPNNLLHELKKKIIALNPDLILSTRSYTCDDISLSTLGVPFRLFHPDYELCPSLCSYYRCIPSNTIRFWIPGFKPSLFKPLFQHLKRDELYNEHDDQKMLLKKLSFILSISLERAAESFEPIGYPSGNFYEISDTSYLREKWGVAPNETAIFVVMGKHSTAAMRNIFDSLNHPKTDHLLRYFFICGKNSSLKSELERDASPSMSICGLLTPEEMNEVMNICALGLSKAGGATTAEAIATRTPLLLMNSYPWEEANAAYLMDLKLAVKADPEKPLIQQIENAVINLKPKSYTQNDWRERLLDKFNELRLKKF